jgi:predicted porin
MVATIVAAAGAFASGGTNAQSASDEEIRQQIQSLQRQLDELRNKLEARQQGQGAATPQPAPVPAPPSAVAPGATAGAVANAPEFLQRKPVEGITFFTRGGEVSIYGNLDLSIDYTTKGISDLVDANGVGPVGNNGWMPAISSNLSYIGVRGFQTAGDLPASFVYQLETQIDVSAMSGTSASNSNTSAVVKGGLTSRNSFIGLSSPQWGALKIGKTDAPYKNSTASMNPFSGMLGDYQVIMGNTGGDNRVEFGTRLSHALWYESPTWSGVNFNVLFAPGQNRASDNSNLPAGEVDCAGGNVPGSGGLPVACNDGAFGSAFSTNIAYRMGDFYVTGAYELHKGVNRTSDLPKFDPNDVADEHAAKVGAQYRFAASGTTVYGIYEKLKRDVPDSLAFQNERSRSGTWLAFSQQLTPKDVVHLGWAHAGATPGDPGQHNTPGGASPDNAANMYTLAYRHQIDPRLSFYANAAATHNRPAAHYDLGAGGRGVTTDCHDASNPDTTGFDPNGNGPHCWAGGKLQGVSVGMKYTF